MAERSVTEITVETSLNIPGSVRDNLLKPGPLKLKGSKRKIRLPF